MSIDNSFRLRSSIQYFRCIAVMCISFIGCATDDTSTCNDIMGSRHQRRKIFPDPPSSRFRHEKGNLIIPVRPGTRMAEPEKDKVNISQPVIPVYATILVHDETTITR